MKSEEFETFLKEVGGLKNMYNTNGSPLTRRGFFSIRDGWLQLVADLIQNLINAGWDRNVSQVKEKFGGLRFYTGGLNEECRMLVDTAEGLSLQTCDVCGSTGTPRSINGWISTRCDEHATTIRNE